jgi:hypothetical protein
MHSLLLWGRPQRWLCFREETKDGPPSCTILHFPDGCSFTCCVPLALDTYQNLSLWMLLRLPLYPENLDWLPESRGWLPEPCPAHLSPAMSTAADKYRVHQKCTRDKQNQWPSKRESPMQVPTEGLRRKPAEAAPSPFLHPSSIPTGRQPEETLHCPQTTGQQAPERRLKKVTFTEHLPCAKHRPNVIPNSCSLYNPWQHNATWHYLNSPRKWTGNELNDSISLSDQQFIYHPTLWVGSPELISLQPS